MHDIIIDFMILGTFDEAPGTVQGPGVRADARYCKIDVLKWLEELVSQSNMTETDVQHRFFMIFSPHGTIRKIHVAEIDVGQGVATLRVSFLKIVDLDSI